MAKKEEMALVPTETTAEKMNEIVLSVTGSEGLKGFKKAYLMASGMKQLRELLTPEFMAPIMELQGSRLGFRTDKDRNKDGTPGPGYSIEIVKGCVIEATLNGLQVTGNQFNIIAGNMYPTKEGCGYILNNFRGLKHQIIIGLPRLNQEGTSAAIEATIKWTLNGENNEEVIPIPVRVNAGMGLDAITGKATRKARAWLISRITGSEITDGEIEDAEAKVMSSKQNGKKEEKSNEEIESQRWLALIGEAATAEELSFYESTIPDSVREAYNKKMATFKA